MNRRNLMIGTATLAVAAFAGAAALYQKPKAPAIPALGLASAVAPAENVLVRFHSPVIGPIDASVTIVEFLDPACEACRAFYPYVKKILSDNPKDVKLVIRYAPLHNGSDEAVRILEASRLQKKFDGVMMALFRDQDQWALHDGPNMERAWEIAGGAGLDLAQAREDAKSPAIAKVLEQELADMKAVNVEGTPTFFINGKLLTEFSPEQLVARVEAEVKVARSG